MQEKMARKKFIQKEGPIVAFIKIWQFLLNIILIQDILGPIP